MKRIATIFCLLTVLAAWSAGTAPAQMLVQGTRAPGDLSALKALAQQAPAQEADWTILFHMTADNNLEMELPQQFGYMLKGVRPGVQLICLVDRHDEYTDYDGNWTDARLFRIHLGADGQARRELLARCGEVNMGHPDVLRDFVAGALKAFPARRTALFMWNHGGGWSNCSNDEKLPDGEGADELDTTETRAALQAGLAAAGRNKFDVIAYEMCLMGQLEVALSVHDLCDYIVFSEAITLGWPLDRMLPHFAPAADPLEACKGTVKGWLEWAGETRDRTLTYSVIQSDKVAPLVAAWDAFARKVQAAAGQDWAMITRSMFFSENYGGRADHRLGPHAIASVDMMDFARRLAQNVPNLRAEGELAALTRARDEAVVINATGPKRQHSTGLALYAPLRQENLNPRYTQDPLASRTAWLSALQSVYARQAQNMTAPRLHDMRVVDSEGRPVQQAAALEGCAVQFSVTADNLLWIVWGVGELQPDGTTEIRLQTFHTVPSERREADQATADIDMVVPVYPEGTSQQAQEIGGIVPRVVAGDTAYLASMFQIDPAEPSKIVVEGLYSHPDLGRQIRCQIFFNAEFWRCGGLVLTQQMPDGRVIHQPIQPAADAKVTLLNQRFDAEGRFTWHEGGTFTWGQGPRLGLFLDNAGKKRMFFQAESIAGPSAFTYIDYDMTISPDITQAMQTQQQIAATELFTDWKIQVPQQDRAGQVQWADVGTFTLRQQEGGGLQYRLETEQLQAEGPATFDRTGIPLLSLYGPDPRNTGELRRLEAYLAFMEREQGQLYVYLRDLARPQILRLSKGGAVPPPPPPPPPGIPNGIYQAANGMVMQVQNNQYATYMNNMMVDQGMFRTQGNQLTSQSAVSGAVEQLIFEFDPQTNILTLRNAQGNIVQWRKVR